MDTTYLFESSTQVENLRSYVSKNRGTVTIDEKLTKLLQYAICVTIAYFFFGRETDKNCDHLMLDKRMVKIIQNVAMMLVGLLGMTIHVDDIFTLYREYVSTYIAGVVPRGDAAGVTAGQSLIQPVIQAMLKTQHKIGAKQSIAGANDIEHLNKLKTKINVIRAHFNRKIAIDQRYLSDKYEQIKIKDVLVPMMGNSRMKIVPFKPEIYSDKTLVFINAEPNKPHRSSQPVYEFAIDPDKLNDASITMIDIVQILIQLTGVTVVIYPLTMMRFDLIKIDNSKVSDSSVITALEETTIKGIEGLDYINTRTLDVSKVLRKVNMVNEEGKKITRMYIDTYYYTQIPLDEIKLRVHDKKRADTKRDMEYRIASAKEDIARGDDVGESESKIRYYTAELAKLKMAAKPVNESLSLKKYDTLFYLDYDIEVELSKEPYTYYYFQGKITIESLPPELREYINHDYTTTNNPHEMIHRYGRGAAITNHEMLYSEELDSTDSDMHYQHISLICASLFSYHLNPFTPASYLRNKGVTALERFAFEQYPEYLGSEAVKAAITTSGSVTTSIFTGNVAKVGTGYLNFQINQGMRDAVRADYKQAYIDQMYDGAYEGIDLPVLGDMEIRTNLVSGVGRLRNNIDPFA